MASSDLTTYYQEVFDFLNSMTLKFSPMADAINTTIINNGGTVDAATPSTWKYYLNLTGQYHPTDTQMTVTSLDTRQVIVFSPATLAVNPKTAAAYVPGQPLYSALCARYPNQVDLIKSIVYPVANINTAINAADFTILAYGTAVLEPDEYDIVLQTMQEFLCYIAKRWYFSFFSYEPYYTWTFWGLLWQQMISVVLLARILAIKTSSVHSWHIWEYLNSYGLGNYSDVLTRTQTLFLYRNIAYLIANRGKQSNLIILSDYLLSGLGVGLYGLDLWQQTTTGAAQCQLTPELVPIGIPTTYVDALPAEEAETVAQIEQRLYTLGTEVDVDADYLAATTVRLGTTPLNTMPTKLLELKPLSTDLKFASYLNDFLLDSLIYAVVNGLYATTLIITEPTTEITLTLSVTDALILYSYCAFQSLLQVPTNIPTQYTIRTAFAQNPTLPTTVAFAGYNYPITDFTNVANYLGAYAWPSTPSITPEDFSARLSTQFLAAINQIQVSRLEEDTISNIALNMLSRAVTVHETVALPTEPGITTYAQWFAAQPDDLTMMITTFNEQASPTETYAALANLILSNLIPATPTFALYGNFAITGTAYTRFRELFVQLCSYNILFLDADSVVETGIFLGKMSSYTASRAITSTLDFPLEAPLLIKHSIADSVPVAPVVLALREHNTYEQVHHEASKIDIHASRQVGGQYRMAPGSTIHQSFTITPAPIRINAQQNDRFYLKPLSS